jgi:cytochrome c-type biogenesis protein CcmE
VARKRSPARLVIALSVAAVLAVFLLYTSIAGGGVPTLRPSQLAGHTGPVTLGGIVVGPVSGDSYGAGGKRFRIRDRKGSASVLVVYHGTVPDLFRVGREVIVGGTMRHGTFVATKDSLVTRCPSKYTAKTKKSY